MGFIGAYWYQPMRKKLISRTLAQVCVGVHAGARECVWVCEGMQGCVRVCTGVRSVGGCA